jgi:hypothetical protein
MFHYFSLIKVLVGREFQQNLWWQTYDSSFLGPQNTPAIRVDRPRHTFTGFRCGNEIHAYTALIFAIWPRLIFHASLGYLLGRLCDSAAVSAPAAGELKKAIGITKPHVTASAPRSTDVRDRVFSSIRHSSFDDTCSISPADPMQLLVSLVNRAFIFTFNCFHLNSTSL